MVNTNFDEDGVDNISIGIVKFARKDFIKGAKILYHNLGKIPTQKELAHDKDHFSLGALKEVRYMYDAWRFVKEDPYDQFGSVSEESVIKAWSDDAVIEYYRDLYSKAVLILYATKGRKELYDIADSSVRKKVKNRQISDGFIKARNYILGLTDGKKMLKEWEINIKMAYKEKMRKEVKKARKIAHWNVMPVKEEN